MSTEIVRSAPATWSFMGDSIDTAARLAETLVKTGLAPRGMTAAQATYVLLAGAELGLRGPVESLRHVIVISGKPAISAELMRALMQQAGCRLEWSNVSAKGATLKVTRPDGSEGTFSFTEADAMRAGLIKPNTPWQSYPQAMYMARVTSVAGRGFCADYLRGASYTPEELGVEVRVVEDGAVEVVHGPEPAKKPAARRKNVAPLPSEVLAENEANPDLTAQLEQSIEQTRTSVIRPERAVSLAIQYRQTFGSDTDRHAWATNILGERVKSFKDLNGQQAAKLGVELQAVEQARRDEERKKAAARPGVAASEPVAEGPPAGHPAAADLPFDDPPAALTADDTLLLAVRCGHGNEGSRRVELGPKMAAKLGLPVGWYDVDKFTPVALKQAHDLFVVLRDEIDARASRMAGRAVVA